MMFVKQTIALIGVVLVVASIVATAEEQVSIEELRISFTKLSKFLESKLSNADDPEASLRAINKHLSSWLPTKRSLLPAIGLFKSIASVQHCTEALFEDVARIQNATRSLSVESIRPIDRLMRTFIERAAKKCDSYHERALVVASTNNEETIFDDQFLKSYFGDRRQYWINFDESSGNIHSDLEKIAKALVEAAKDDPNNELILKDFSQDTTLRPPKPEGVHYLVKKYILDGCQKYAEHIDPIISNGHLISNYYPGGEEFFLRARSDNYKNWLLRTKFCHTMTSKTSEVENLIELYFQGRP